MFRNVGKYRLVYGLLWGMYVSYWQVPLSYGLQFVARICRLIFLPIAISLIITRLSVHNFSGAQQAVLFYVVVSLVLGVVTPLIKYVGMRGENQIYRNTTASYFAKLVGADIDYFNSNLAGYLTTATRQYCDSTLILVRNVRDRYLGTVLSIVFPLIVIFWLDHVLGLVALALSLVQATYLFWASSALAPFRTKTREYYKKHSGTMADVISNILAVKAAAQEHNYVEQIRRNAFREAESFRKRYTVQSKLIATREFITVFFFMALLWLTVQRMSGGFITITTAVLVVTYTTTILNGIYMLSDDLDEHDDLVDKIMPAFEILNRQNTVSDPEHPVELTNIKGDVELKHVSFAYQEQQGVARVFTDFSLHIPHGQKIGVVGLSGAGKSTLTKLLLRFNDVDEGEVLVDGVDVRLVRQADLRRNIAYVPQEPLLFHTSIRENLLLAKPNASNDELRHALRVAHAANFVDELPQGIESIVGERGVKLSGGQKQRVAIARAVLQEAPIMVLDEATSALDSESEQIIKSSFTQILKGKTAIVIAHRLSTLSEMDRIIVIDNGQIAEDGTHHALLVKDGIYAGLWHRQQRGLEGPGSVTLESELAASATVPDALA